MRQDPIIKEGGPRFTAKDGLDKIIEIMKQKGLKTVLDVGCGKMPYRDFILDNSAVTKYVGIDIENALTYDQTVKPDYTWDGKSMPFHRSWGTWDSGSSPSRPCAATPSYRCP